MNAYPRIVSETQKMYKIGFIGLSGVGKSSIINTLTEKPLAPCGPDNPTLKRAEYLVKKITYVDFPGSDTLDKAALKECHLILLVLANNRLPMTGKEHTIFRKATKIGEVAIVVNNCTNNTVFGYPPEGFPSYTNIFRFSTYEPADYDGLAKYIKVSSKCIKYPRDFQHAYNLFKNWRQPYFSTEISKFVSLISGLRGSARFVIKMLNYIIGDDTPWVDKGPCMHYVQGMGITRSNTKAYVVDKKWDFLVPLSKVDPEIAEFCMAYMDSLSIIYVSRVGDDTARANIAKYTRLLLHPWSISADVYAKFTNTDNLMIPNIMNRADLDSDKRWSDTKAYIMERINTFAFDTGVPYMAAYILYPEVPNIPWIGYSEKNPEWITRNIEAIKYRFRPMFTQKVASCNAFIYNVEPNSPALLSVENALEFDYHKNILWSKKQ